MSTNETIARELEKVAETIDTKFSDIDYWTVDEIKKELTRIIFLLSDRSRMRVVMRLPEETLKEYPTAEKFWYAVHNQGVGIEIVASPNLINELQRIAGNNEMKLGNLRSDVPAIVQECIACLRDFQSGPGIPGTLRERTTLALKDYDALYPQIKHRLEKIQKRNS